MAGVVGTVDKAAMVAAAEMVMVVVAVTGVETAGMAAAVVAGAEATALAAESREPEFPAAPVERTAKVGNAEPAVKGELAVLLEVQAQTEPLEATDDEAAVNPSTCSREVCPAGVPLRVLFTRCGFRNRQSVAALAAIGRLNSVTNPLHNGRWAARN